MTEAAETYSGLADASRSQAAEQILDNVRDKHLASAARWDALAFSERKMSALRLSRLEEQASPISKDMLV